MTERDKFEQWASQLFGVPTEHLKACRYVDDNGVEGYDGLQGYGYTEHADDLMAVAWLSRKELMEGPEDN